ncbi:hypothetical protein D9M72_603690 [compost metagenome]
MLQEIAAHFREEEDHGREEQQEAGNAQRVVHRVVGVERDAVQRDAILILLGLDLDAVRVVRTHFVQRDDVGDDQRQQHQRHGDDVEREEAVQRGVAHHVVTADEQRQVLADHGNRREQVHDHLGAPV